MTLPRWFHRERVPSADEPAARQETERPPGNGPDSSGPQIAAWLAALEAGRLNPPRDLRDPLAWDAYWTNQIEVGAIDQGFSDLMSSDPTLPGLLGRRGSRTILCAGNGLSSEALALALFGFQVTALDIAAVPVRVFGRLLRHPDQPVRRIPGFGIDDDNTVSIACDGPIDSALCPAMHRSAGHAHKGGGSLAFVTGDLMDPGMCPGPFDVVIERRTVQLFPEHDQPTALEHLSRRLADRGVFVSHEHRGGWRPSQPRTHYAASWLASRGFVIHSKAEADHLDSAARLAVLQFSTG